MVIDIIGAPGAGKTTICNRIIKELSAASAPYLDMTGRKDTPVWIKLYIRACMVCVMVLPQYRRMYKEIENKLSSYPKITDKYFYSDRIIIMKDVVRHVFAHKLYERKRTYLLNDEGILHKMLPLTIQHGVPVELLIEIYKSFNLNLQLIYVKSEVDQAYNNSRNRNRHDCSYDDMDDEELRGYLEAYYNVLGKVLQNESYISTDICSNFPIALSILNHNNPANC